MTPFGRSVSTALLLVVVLSACTPGAVSVDDSTTRTGLPPAERSRLATPSEPLAVRVVVSPAESGGPHGTPCRGTGENADLAYGYRVDFTAARGTRHVAFLGDSATGVDVRWDPADASCEFALLLLYVDSGPYVLDLGGHQVTLSAAQAQQAIVVLYV